MLKKEITYFGQKAVIACDGKCEKAWGLNNRPKVQLSEDDDDYCYLADDELDIAPIDPMTYEGNTAKPITPEDKLNKWCTRECERCSMSNPGEYDKPLALNDFSVRVCNIEK